MTKMLEPIGRTLIFSPACRVTPVGIEWTRKPTDDEIKADDYMVQRCGESVGWWMGDLIVMLWKREGADQSLSQYAAVYARARGVNEKTAEQYAHIAQFFPVVKRFTRPITWGHHQIVWGRAKSGELGGALKWLGRAMRGDKAGPWSTGRLREEMSASARGAGEVREPSAPIGDFDGIMQIEGWAQTRVESVQKITPSTAKEMLERFRSTIAFIEALRTRAAAKR